MHQMKEPTQAVYMRIKQSNHDWLKAQAKKEDRPVTWLVNKLIEQTRNQQAEQGAKA